MKSMVCWGKSKIGKCYIYSINNRLDEDIKIAEHCLDNIARYRNVMERCIKKNSIEEVLRLRGEYLNTFYWNEVREKEINRKISNGEYPIINKRKITSCRLNSKSCKSDYESKKNYLEKLMNQIDNKVQEYNDDLAIIKKVQNYCLNDEESNVHNDKGVYFKFGRDKYNSLIALYFDIDNFVDTNSYSRIKTIFVFSGEGEDPYDKQTMLHLKYERFHMLLEGTEAYEKAKQMIWESSHVYICEFQSFNSRRGHGTFILKHLEDIIKATNRKITVIQNKVSEEYPRRVEIKSITGEVVPDSTISYEDLVRFYNKNGLTTIGKKYSDGTYAPNRIIFKELE